MKVSSYVRWLFVLCGRAAMADSTASTPMLLKDHHSTGEDALQVMEADPVYISNTNATAPDIKEGSPYKNQVSQLRSPSNQPPLVHGCVGPLGGSTNWNAIAGWVKYHEERWGLTHADIFVLDDEFHVAQDAFDAAGVDSNVALSFNLYSPTSGEAWLANQCRANANEGNRDFLIEFDPDQFLVADSFDSLQDLFTYTNSPDAVVFPTFVNHYDICSSNAMTFASATFVDHLFPSFDRAPYECPREKRCNMSDGVVRHFMIAEDLGVAKAIRFANMASGKLTGLHEDMTTMPCLQVKSCKYIGDEGDCTDMGEIALYEQQVSSINTILSDLSLSAKMNEIKQRAVCYAQRYPSLLDGFCHGDISQCHYGALYDHYVNHGSAENLIWECDDEVAEEIKQLAVCYAQRYPDLFEGYCSNDVNKCHYSDIYHHYVNHGADSNLIWACDRETSTANAVTQRRRLAVAEEDQDPLELYILLFETDHTRVPDIPLAKQAAAAGISLMTFGAGVDFDGFGTKWGLALSALDDVPPDALVVISDGRDVILNIHGKDGDYGQKTIGGFEQAYRALTYDKPGAVIMSAEGQCCVSALTYVKPGAYFHPDGTRAEHACASGEEGCVWAGDSNRLPWEHMMQELAKDTQGEYIRDSYLNAGLVAGRAKDVKRVIELANIKTFEDDQAVFTDLLYNWPNLLVLDYAQEMFANMRWTDGMDGGGCNVERDESTPLGGLVHAETQTVPLFLHTPGKFLDCLAHLTDQLEISTSPIRERHLQAIPPSCNYGPGSDCPPRPNVCTYVECDFAELTPNVVLDNTVQAGLLYDICGVKVTAVDFASAVREVNVFDSTRANPGTSYRRDDPDLAAPNEYCPGGGPGKGDGGKPGMPFPNCSPQGNLLIIQDPRVSSDKANDSGFGGCFTFEFQSPIDFIDMGLMDLEEETTIVFYTEDGVLSPYKSPPDVGDNGFWPMSKTFPDVSYKAVGVVKIELCFPKSGGISFLNYHDCLPTKETVAPSPTPVYTPSYTPVYTPSDTPVYTPSYSPVSSPVCIDKEEKCDFSFLTPGVAVSEQMQALMTKCYMKVMGSNTINNNPINVFDSADVSNGDTDLGSPNRQCPGGGPGRGRGGIPGSMYENCEFQDNLLIFQNDEYPITKPNDSKFGGCFEFYFTKTVTLTSISILDIDDLDVAEAFINGSNEPAFSSPSDIGNNGLWTSSIPPIPSVTELKVCLPGSGGISSVSFTTCI